MEEQTINTDKPALGLFEIRIIMGAIIGVMIVLTAYTIYNVEEMKADPLTYLEDKLGSTCKCYCMTPEGYVGKIYSNNDSDAIKCPEARCPMANLSGFIIKT